MVDHDAINLSSIFVYSYMIADMSVCLWVMHTKNVLENGIKSIRISGFLSETREVLLCKAQDAAFYEIS